MFFCTFITKLSCQYFFKIIQKTHWIQNKAREHYNNGCCNGRCIWEFSLSDCIQFHKFYYSKSQADATTWLRTVINSCTVTEDGVPKTQLVVSSTPVCHTAFKKLYGISNTKFGTSKKGPENAVPIHGNIANNNATRTTARSYLKFWLEEFADTHGDADPKKSLVHIPSYIARSNLYDLFSESWKKSKYSKDAIPSPSIFYSYLDNDFSHLHFLQKTRLGRCSFCVTANEKRLKITDKVEKLSFQQALRNHNALHTGERESFGARVHKSKAHPDHILHMCFDSPDSYWLPNRQLATSKTSYLIKSEVHAVGCSNYSSGKSSYMYYLPQWKKDPNLIITVMWMQIVEHLSNTPSRPSVLWLQLDNCYRENKNNFLFGFLAWLLAKKIFTEVMCSYLMVGHTHNNLDQVFSTASIYQDSHSIFSFTHLIQSLRLAYKKDDSKPSGAFLPAVWNWIGFLGAFH